MVPTVTVVYASGLHSAAPELTPATGSVASQVVDGTTSPDAITNRLGVSFAIGAAVSCFTTSGGGAVLCAGGVKVRLVVPSGRSIGPVYGLFCTSGSPPKE